MNKADLREIFERARVMDYKYIALEIKQDGRQRNEVIVVHNSNFNSKWEYIEKAYNDDLALVNAPFIEIIDACFGDSFEELELNLAPNM